ncbi:hypothetical protein Taro_053039 [Colocasia esculenta]|uniref:5'-3' exoribonuclease n=1 Tax=Colocasia esculenta TaxID=4460 RepID=A0A843XJV5_COLES|nr:hypothetical protein [Colocasia esculenta]
MGVPSFYRWLVGKYPKIVMEAEEESGDPVDSSLPNPNGIEFDNLYLDMNGIIHPCFHPDDQLFPPSTFDEVFQSIFHYIDRIFRIVRPRKLLYMAIDGVAPRAKMNQQRARRYRTAKDAEFAEAEEEKLREQFMAEGRQVLPKQESEAWDSNVITPGTVFMEKLSRALEYYIRLRLNNDPGWKDLKVILSDANVPGEGEHKIMSFIRLQRNLPGYNPNTLHCLYGLDADLIMLALATHELHFTILREDVSSQQPAGDIASALEMSFSKVQYERLKSRESFEKAASMSRCYPNKRYQFLKIWTLRKYLELDLGIPDPPFNIDLERQIDDFIFMCFFTGNDFLPHLPSIEIIEGAIDLLIHVYKSEFKKIGGYLVDTSQVTGNTKELMQTVKNIIKEKSDLFKQGSLSDKVRLGFPGWRERYYKEKFNAATPDERKNQQKELVTKYTEGLCWVLQYYFAGVCSWNWFYPFHYGPFASDIKGITCSNMQFTLGAPFKPFDQLMAVLPPRSAHALPKPFQSLMTDQQSGVREMYPTGIGLHKFTKSNLLPIMCECLTVVFVTDFEVDVDGKRYLWQGIAKLPFITEGLLITETRKLEIVLDQDEQKRNSVKLDKLFVLRSHHLGGVICFLHHSQKHPTEQGRKEMSIPIECNKSDGMNGFLCLHDDKPEVCSFSSPVKGMVDIMGDHVVSAFYKNPTYHDHVPRLLENVNIPLEEITESDVVQRILWHEQDGRPAPQPCRGEPQQNNSNISNAARNASQRHSPTLLGTNRGSWKAAESRMRGRGRGASEGHFYHQIPIMSPSVSSRGDTSVSIGNARQPAMAWRAVREKASCSEGFGQSQTVDGGSPWQVVRGRSRGGHSGASNRHVPAGRGREEGRAAFLPLAGGIPETAGGSSASGRGAWAETKAGRGRGSGLGKFGVLSDQEQ